MFQNQRDHILVGFQLWSGARGISCYSPGSCGRAPSWLDPWSTSSASAGAPQPWPHPGDHEGESRAVLQGPFKLKMCKPEEARRLCHIGDMGTSSFPHWFWGEKMEFLSTMWLWFLLGKTSSRARSLAQWWVRKLACIAGLQQGKSQQICTRKVPASRHG